MRQSLPAILILALASICFAQGSRPYSSLGGYGNILYPGVGHAPGVSLTPTAYGSRSGRGGAPARAPYAGHPSHSGAVIVPYPVYYGGYYGTGYYNNGYVDPSQQAAYSGDAPPPNVDPNGAPSVVVNQTFIPDRPVPMVRDYTGDTPDGSAPPESSGMRMYEGLRTPPYAPRRGRRRTINRLCI